MYRLPTLNMYIRASSPANRAIYLPWQETLAMEYYDAADSCNDETEERYLRYWGDRTALCL